MIQELLYKVKIHFKRKRFAAIFMLSYIFIAIIPLLIFGFILNQYFFGILEGKIHESNKQVVQQFKNSFDSYFITLKDISQRIYADTELTAQKMYSNPLTAMEGIKNLQKYTIGNSYIDNVLLYLPEVDKVYSSTNALTLDDFFYINRFDGLTENDLRSIVTGISEMAISKPYNVSTIVTDIVKNIAIVSTPILPVDVHKDRILLYFIKLSNLEKITNDTNPDMLVFTEDNNLLLAGNNLSEPRKYISEIIQHVNSKSQDKTIVLGNTQYYLQYVSSNNTGLKYLLLMPSKTAMSEIIRMRIIFIFVMAITVLILGIIIAYSIRLNFNPLKLTFKRIFEIIGQSNAELIDYEMVNNALDSIESERESINYKYNSAKSALKEQLLNRLLTDEINSVQEFNKEGQDLQLTFSYDCFCVAALCFKKPFSQNDKPYIIEKIKRCIYDVECYFLPMLDGKITLFICMQYPDEAILLAIMEDIREELAKNQLYADIGVGNIYSGIRKVTNSYMEALSALEYRSVNDNGVVFFKWAKENMEWFDVGYPEKKIQLLEVLLLEGDIEKIISTVDEIILYMNGNKLPLNVARCLCYDIINTLLKTMRVISDKYTPIKDKIPDIMSLSSFNTSEALSDKVRSVCMDICQHMKNTKEAHIENLAIHIIEYINENYCDSRFSIRTMADDLGLSLNSVNTYFKKYVNKTPLEYVNEKRLSLSKQLLTDSNLPLNEITLQIGYLDTSSFLRKFHKETGVTPGQYRRLHHSKNTE